MRNAKIIYFSDYIFSFVAFKNVVSVFLQNVKQELFPDAFKEIINSLFIKSIEQRFLTSRFVSRR